MRPGELIPLQSAPPEVGNEFFHRKIRLFLALFRVVDRRKPLACPRKTADPSFNPKPPAKADRRSADLFERRWTQAQTRRITSKRSE